MTKTVQRMGLSLVCVYIYIYIYTSDKKMESISIIFHYFPFFLTFCPPLFYLNCLKGREMKGGKRKGD